MITQSMIDAKIQEIEEPLVTIYEFAEKTKLSVDILRREATKLKIQPYTIFDGRHYTLAFNEVQVKEILQSRGPQYIRKNKLDISHLL